MKYAKRRKYTNGNRELLPSEVERYEGEVSATVPGETFTIGELMMRFGSGGMPESVSLAAELEGYDEPSHEDHDLEMVSRLDITDRDELRVELADRVASLEESLKPDPTTAPAEPEKVVEPPKDAEPAK